MLVLVTGAAGFIGSHVAQRLLADGHRVVAVDSFHPYYARTIKERNLEPVRRHAAARFVEADLARADLASIVEGVDAVVHLAARSRGGRSPPRRRGARPRGGAGPRGTR